METSICGFICSECIYGKNGMCGKCIPGNELRKGCKMIECAESKGYRTCMECLQRINCSTYKESLRHCPLRIALLRKAESGIGGQMD